MEYNRAHTVRQDTSDSVATSCHIGHLSAAPSDLRRLTETPVDHRLHDVLPRVRGSGNVYQRGPHWWLRFYWMGHDVSMSARRVLGRPATSRDDALEALRRARASAHSASRGLSRSLLDFQAKSSVVPPSLRGTVGDPDFDIQAADLMRGRGPVVYAWVRGRKVLYIGSSLLGLSRPLFEKHHRLRLSDLHPTDRLMVWRYKHGEEARAVESLLIKHARPLLNGAPGGSRG